MGMFSGLGGMLGGMAGTFFGMPQLGTMIGSGLGGLGDNVLGSKMDTMLQKDRMDTLYPGTNPWERLPSGGGGSANPGAVQQQIALDKQLQNQKEIAQLQANNNLEIAHVQTQPQYTKLIYEMNNIEAQTNKMRQEIQESLARTNVLGAQERHIGAQTKNQIIQNDIANITLEYADRLEMAKLTNVQVSDAAGIISRLVQDVDNRTEQQVAADYAALAAKVGSKLADVLLAGVAGFVLRGRGSYSAPGKNPMQNQGRNLTPEQRRFWQNYRSKADQYTDKDGVVHNNQPGVNAPDPKQNQ